MHAPTPKLYDVRAQLPIAIARTLMGWMAPTTDTGVAVDVGCATAPMSWQQRRLKPHYQWWALDAAFPMLLEAQERGRLAADYQAVCAQAPVLPFADGSVDTLFSSFALPWYENRTALAQESYRVARSGAEFFLAVPIQGSLYQLLRSGFPLIGAQQSIAFAKREEWLRDMSQVGWQLERETEQHLTEYFPAMANVLEQLSYVGIRQDDGPSGFLSAYNNEQEEHGFPVSWRVLYLHFKRH
ncbi:MAG TPA: methyltransferase domain-containing protein [Alcanivoracaceae bacterium]|nr:methyltransferase domain-containing protein [Alcanivoracaceae bacterium]